jgi:6-phospho-3-hexuloisomerase
VNGAASALSEIRDALSGVSEPAVDAICHGLCQARRIVLYGCGREGLMMRALAMRLYHLGMDVAMQGDMACPPVHQGDVLFVSAGPGYLSTVAALMGQSKNAGAQTFLLTAEPEAVLAQSADLVLTIPAQTMARDIGSDRVLPMGSVFEGAMFVLFELMVLRLRDLRGETVDSMRARHTNLE